MLPFSVLDYIGRLVLSSLPLHVFTPTTTAGLVSHSDLDDRAIEALKEFNDEGALQVLLQFKDSDLSHVQVRKQRPQYLCTSSN